ncbi:hypothetical protein SDC9_174888 [bioreactor metagenome]|uniref:Uncharacterized protein n=1 Tax=bioreactor metagenome TaxID=1076179 RepID=A0A645GL60_9ZZZZ
MKGNPVLPGTLPLPDNGVIVLGKHLPQALFHQAAERGDHLRKRRDKAVRQRYAHRAKQIALRFVLLPKRVGGDGAREPQVNIGYRNPLRGTKRERRLRHGQHGVMPAQAV